MFRPNRVGTPFFWNDQYTTADTPVAFVQSPIIKIAPDVSWPCNVINSVPIADYGGFTAVHAISGGSLAPGMKYGIIAQINIQAPEAGNIVGVELSGTWLQQDSRLVTAPYFSILTAATETEWAVGAFDLPPIQIGDIALRDGLPDTGNTKIAHFRTQVIIENNASSLPEFPAGPYGFGFWTFNAEATPEIITPFQVSLHCRQLNDQQFVGYRDTLK